MKHWFYCVRYKIAHAIYEYLNPRLLNWFEDMVYSYDFGSPPDLEDGDEDKI